MTTAERYATVGYTDAPYFYLVDTTVTEGDGVVATVWGDGPLAYRLAKLLNEAEQGETV